MSYQLASRQVVSIVGDTNPTYTDRALSDSFRYLRDASDDELIPTRSYQLAPTGGRTQIPGQRGARDRYFTDVVLSVYYEVQHDIPKLYELMMSDYEDIEGRLRNPSNWDRGSSSIVSIALDGGDVYLEHSIDPVGDPPVGMMLNISFPLIYRP